MADRWATFDCYGTLIDWNAGIRLELARVFGEGRADELLARYHELEPELEADGSRSYAEVMTEAMRRLGAPTGEEEGLAGSLPAWEPIPELLQACSPPLGALLRGDGSRPRGARARRGEPLPRRRAGPRARAQLGLDQPARRAARPRADA
ncbi:MAG: hypothetical protein E6G42_03050 [Actinobacteria bacterium]|nr:MAG: hypothetical protein E6G42_03050 [Actinomycetota bacterium]